MLHKFVRREHLVYVSTALFALLIFSKTDNTQNSERIPIPLIGSTGPVTAGQINAARDSFELYYDRANQNLNTTDVGVKTDSLMAGLFQKYPSRKDSGYVFHYALSSDETSIFYIMSNGVYDALEDTTYFYPFPKDKYNDNFDYYILLHGSADSGEYRAIDESEFCNFTGRYEKNFNKLHDTIITPVSSIANHPFSVYHEGSELNEFFNEYEPNTTDLMLIRHCAGPIGADNHSYHIPVFIFMLPGNGNTDYSGKALDIGNVCPPSCSATMEGFCN